MAEAGPGAPRPTALARPPLSFRDAVPCISPFRDDMTWRSRRRSWSSREGPAWAHPGPGASSHVPLMVAREGGHGCLARRRDASPADHRDQRGEEDARVHPRAHRIDVLDVGGELLPPGERVAARYLSEPGDARSDV